VSFNYLHDFGLEQGRQQSISLSPPLNNPSGVIPQSSTRTNNAQGPFSCSLTLDRSRQIQDGGNLLPRPESVEEMVRVVLSASVRIGREKRAAEGGGLKQRVRGYNFTVKEVFMGGTVEPSFVGGDIRDIAYPDPVR
jgi:hypothetical protein